MSEPLNPYAPPQANIIPAPVDGNILPPASRWHRLLASLLDTIILMAVLLPLQWLTGSFDRMQNSSLLEPESIVQPPTALKVAVAETQSC